MDKWDACAFPVSEDDLEGRICYRRSGFVLYHRYHGFRAGCSRRWMRRINTTSCRTSGYRKKPLDLRVRRDHVPYDLWERQGTLMTTEGNVVHYGYIEKFIERLGEKFNIREIAFDALGRCADGAEPWRAWALR